MEGQTIEQLYQNVNVLLIKRIYRQYRNTRPSEVLNDTNIVQPGRLTELQELNHVLLVQIDLIFISIQSRMILSLLFHHSEQRHQIFNLFRCRVITHRCWLKCFVRAMRKKE